MDEIITVDIPELVKKGILPYGTTAKAEDVVKGKTFYSNSTTPDTGTLDMDNYELKLPHQEKTITPAIVEQEVVADEGYKLTKVTVEQVTSNIDENINENTILDGVSILGVTGKVLPRKEEVNIKITPTVEDQEFIPEEDKAFSKVVVEAVTSEIDNNLQPYNIRTGINILGVEGNLEPDKPDQIKEVRPKTEVQEILADTGYELGKVVIDAMRLEERKVSPKTEVQEITPSGNNDGLSKVTVEAMVLQEKTVNPTTEVQEIVPDLGADGLNRVTVNKVTSEIDSNILSSNIKKDVTILGVTGALEAEEQIRNTEDTTNRIKDTLYDYKFYNDEDNLVTGTIQSRSGGTYTTNQILNTAGKYLTSDIIVNVSGGDSRLENDTLYKIKSIDFMRAELGDEYPITLPTDEEYEEQQEYIDSVIEDLSLTNFIQYTIDTQEELMDTLDFKKLHPSKYLNLDSTVNLINNITYSDKEPLERTVDTSSTTATANKVRNGRLFYNKNGELTTGEIDTVVGKRIDKNTTIPTAGKYVSSNIEVFVPSGTKNPNETLNEMKTLGKAAYQLGDLNYNELPTDEDYIEQQDYVNATIKEIQGVEF